MSNDVNRAIEALIKSIAVGKHTPNVSAAKSQCAITVSRSTGSGGDDVARTIAERLKVGYFDRAIISAVSEKAHVEEQLMERLDEQVEGMKDAWLRSLITGKSVFKTDYRRNLINVVLGFARTGGVIVGRGANFILADRQAFRVRIVGSLSRCAARIAKREKMGRAIAEQQVRETDQMRSEFIRQLYDQEIDDPKHYDLTINSDHMSSDTMAEIVLLAIERTSFARPDVEHAKACS